MQTNSPLSTAVRLFEPQAASPLTLVDDTPRGYPARNGLARGSGITAGSPVGSACLSHHYTSDEESVSTNDAISEKSLCRRHGGRGNPSNQSGSDSNVLLPPEGDIRKRMGSLVRSRSQNLGARRVILMTWLTPLGSGLIVSHIIMSTVRIPTSCP